MFKPTKFATLYKLAAGALLSQALVMSQLAVAGLDEASPEAKARGLEIAKASEKADEGWGDFTAEMKMTLINARGDTSTREIRMKNLEVNGDGDKSLTVFDKPADVKGTAFLSFTHALVPDEQWLYLPALKRVKRISSANKSGPFMGSEFAFEDLSSFEVEKYDYEYLRDEMADGMDSYVVRNYPRYAKSGYTYRDVWIDKVHYRPIKTEFYDRKGSHLKTLEFLEYHQYVDKFWRAHKTRMTNHQTGKSTETQWFDFQFGTGLSDSDFNKSTLKRMR